MNQPHSPPPFLTCPLDCSEGGGEILGRRLGINLLIVINFTLQTQALNSYLLPIY